MKLAEGPVRVPKAAELVAARIRSRIVRGDLAAGDTLPGEAELASEFAISRPTVREALRILESESLISVGRGARNGARVHLPSHEVAARHTGLLLQVQGTTLADLYEARVQLFAPAARLLAERHTVADVDALRAAVDKARDLADQPEEFLAAAAEFNLLVLELAGNHTLRVLAGMLNHIVERHLESAARDWIDNPRHGREATRVCEALDELVGLIARGKGAAAEAFWREQMESSAQYMLKHFGALTVVDLLEK